MPNVYRTGESPAQGSGPQGVHYQPRCLRTYRRERTMMVAAEYREHNEFLRFDQYSVIRKDGDFHVEKILSNVCLVGACAMAGVEEYDFIESVAETGWCGSRPE